MTVHRDKFLKLHPLISQTYFWNKTLHVSDGSSVHHQEFSTVHTAVGIFHTGLLIACEQDQDGVPSWSCSQAVWHIPLLCVQWKTPDDGQRNCPKHVEFYSKNKFEKLLHLFDFIIRIYHDARSPERQIHCLRYYFQYVALRSAIWTTYGTVKQVNRSHYRPGQAQRVPGS